MDKFNDENKTEYTQEFNMENVTYVLNEEIKYDEEADLFIVTMIRNGKEFDKPFLEREEAEEFLQEKLKKMQE